MSDALTAAVRMYRFDQELGDCFLLTFNDGSQKSHMLIDCGSFQNAGTSKARLTKILADITQTLDGAALDVVVGTHQHNDHLSGFVHCERAFRKIGVEHVWLSWLDDPKDARANSIGRQHHNLMNVMHDVRAHMTSRRNASTTHRAIGILDDVLGFYGAKGKAPPKIPAEAVRIMKGLGRNAIQYLKPGAILDLPGLAKDRVKVYVLGPPRKDALTPRKDDPLYRKDPREGESYDHALSSARSAAEQLLNAAKGHSGSVSSEEAQYPFAEKMKYRKTARKTAGLRRVVGEYGRSDSLWRTIDDDWMNQAESLALFMDGFTNNSSLVLAIELVSSGKILLFTADAQTGNWLSWFDVKWSDPKIDTDDLLARAVLYKVGHHGSHNATLLAALEKMTSPALVALIPVHKKDSNVAKTNGWKMPARNLHRRLVAKTSNRVLQMDGEHTLSCNFRRDPARQAWKRIGIEPRETELYIEVTIKDE